MAIASFQKRRRWLKIRRKKRGRGEFAVQCNICYFSAVCCCRALQCANCQESMIATAIGMKTRLERTTDGKKGKVVKIIAVTASSFSIRRSVGPEGASPLWSVRPFVQLRLFSSSRSTNKRIIRKHDTLDTVLMNHRSIFFY